MREPIIQVDHVGKKYRLGVIGGGTLQGDLQSWWARKCGKEDPNSKIGSKVYNKNEQFWALKDLNFEIYKGETVGIIGHNGAGKSTFLKLLSRVTAPTEGEIRVDGRVSSMLEVGTGFHPELTGRENIYMNGAILGMTRSEVDKKIDDIIEFSECAQFIDTPVKRYSSGMYVKLAFAVAAHLDSEILVMDEVLAVGDMKFQQKCLGKMGNVASNDGRTVLYVSHNMSTIQKLCSRCLVLDHGQVIFDGDTDQAIDIYLASNQAPQQKRVFDESDHESWCNQKIIVNQAELQEDIGRVKSGDILHFDLNCTAIQDIDTVMARLVFLDEKEEKIGMSITENPVAIHKGENIIHFTLDTRVLSKGKYILRYSMFEMNEFGTHDYICVLNDFFTLELKDNEVLHHGMNWSISSWGHTVLDDLKIYVE